MNSFTKLSSDIIHSSVWCEPMPTKIVWITLLAMADQYGRVGASIPGLAKAAGVTVNETRTALDVFMAPDAYSRTPDNEGRRIEPIDGGWRLLNYGKKREERDEEHQRTRHAKNQAAYRDRQKSLVTDAVTMIGHVTESDPIADADADADRDSSCCYQKRGTQGDPEAKASLSSERGRRNEAREAREASEAPVPKEAKEASVEIFQARFGIPEPSPLVSKIAKAIGTAIGVEQDMDLTRTEITRLGMLEEASPESLKLALRFALSDRYWVAQMKDENGGRGALMLFIRALDTLRSQSKRTGVKTQAKKGVQFKAASVDPKNNPNFKFSGESI